ncbi:MAG: ABC transporter permease [Muribaculum sp.]|nr:ABC transporter permease [Muribaculum sp.]
MNIVNRLVRKNVSTTQLVGFLLSNFIGLAIVIVGLQFYLDMRSLWNSEDSFIKKDYLVINKKVTASNTLGSADARFGVEEIADLEKQPWVRRVGQFMAPDYHVRAYMDQGGRGLSTDMFFESIPSDFIDVKDSNWKFDPASGEVPIIISKDYLTLYNFGFASSAGLPQVSEQMMRAVPLTLHLSSDDGVRRQILKGRVVGYSNRLNTILVPEDFYLWSENLLGGSKDAKIPPSRLIIDVSSPGDVAINQYLDAHDLEIAGDKSSSRASYLLNIVVGVMLAVGCVITVLSFFILLLSISLLMQKIRDKLHALIMLGYDLNRVAAPFRRLIWMVSLGAWALGVIAMLVFRSLYVSRIAGIEGARVATVWLPIGIGLAIALLSVLFNILSVRKKVTDAF